MQAQTPGPAQPGQVVGGKYRVAQLIGVGGMGRVYEAENTWTGRRVALKVLDRRAAASQGNLERFVQEARTASQLAHPNIVQVLDLVEDPNDGTLYIVQEFLEGEDLSKRLEEHGRLSPSEALRLLIPVMSALVAAHERGVVHRDIKPDNIFLARGPNGETVPKLIDFGVSKMLNADPALRKTRTGITIGTPYYMAPEQARGESDIDGRADIWSVGAVLFELLTARCPYEAENYNLLVAKVITEPPPRIEALDPNLPPAVVQLVNTALQHDRRKRYASMQELLRAALGTGLLRYDGGMERVSGPALPAVDSPSRPPLPGAAIASHNAATAFLAAPASKGTSTVQLVGAFIAMLALGGGIVFALRFLRPTAQAETNPPTTATNTSVPEPTIARPTPQQTPVAPPPPSEPTPPPPQPVQVTNSNPPANPQRNPTRPGSSTSPRPRTNRAGDSLTPQFGYPLQ